MRGVYANYSGVIRHRFTIRSRIRFEQQKSENPENDYWPQRVNQLRPVLWAEGDLNPHVPKDTGT
jgi:hypothetical protein